MLIPGGGDLFFLCGTYTNGLVRKCQIQTRFQAKQIVTENKQLAELSYLKKVA